MRSNYAPTIPTEPTTTSPTPTIQVSNDMQQFYITIISLVIASVIIITIFAMFIKR